MSGHLPAPTATHVERVGGLNLITYKSGSASYKNLCVSSHVYFRFAFSTRRFFTVRMALGDYERSNLPITIQATAAMRDAAECAHCLIVVPDLCALVPPLIHS